MEPIYIYIKQETPGKAYLVLPCQTDVAHQESDAPENDTRLASKPGNSLERSWHLAANYLWNKWELQQQPKLENKHTKHLSLWFPHASPMRVRVTPIWPVPLLALGSPLAAMYCLSDRGYQRKRRAACCNETAQVLSEGVC